MLSSSDLLTSEFHDIQTSEILNADSGNLLLHLSKLVVDGCWGGNLSVWDGRELGSWSIFVADNTAGRGGQGYIPIDPFASAFRLLAVRESPVAERRAFSELSVCTFRVYTFHPTGSNWTHLHSDDGTSHRSRLVPVDTHVTRVRPFFIHNFHIQTPIQNFVDVP
ncbi:unnamed protein product [Phytophthora fragariaefolia]|uniref:Unnamed protein product n=1 Tax=Phytophthora fragariaefolia TaxID=1490495 RepID=A0A9W6Y5B2_9STRA|nr:unnamed protein product [Phytophthora fragariaefolia]